VGSQEVIITLVTTFGSRVQEADIILKVQILKLLTYHFVLLTRLLPGVQWTF
jgi:hypothetical protein